MIVMDLIKFNSLYPGEAKSGFGMSGNNFCIF